LQYGKVEEPIIAQSVRRKVPLPDAIRDAPELWAGLDLYWTGFMDLINSRSIGFSLGPIDWRTIEDYCDKLDLDEYQKEAMHHHIGVMDTAFIEFKSRKT